MKNIKKILNNNLKIIKYTDEKNIQCECNKCEYSIIDNYRNLSYKNFKCKYCTLIEKSELIKNKKVKIIKIENSFIHLKCQNGHLYKQNRRNLLANKYCLKCYLENKMITREMFLNKAIEIHDNLFTYNLNDYENVHSKIEITCKNEHIFTQKVYNHLQGKSCPLCNQSHGERKIEKILNNKNLKFEKQKKFNECRNILELLFDFYIPTLNLLIEFDGIQHFEKINWFGGKKGFEKRNINDNIKTQYCINNKIPLLRISYLDNIEVVLLEYLNRI